MKTFLDLQKLREFIASSLSLYGILKKCPAERKEMTEDVNSDPQERCRPQEILNM